MEIYHLHSMNIIIVLALFSFAVFNPLVDGSRYGYYYEERTEGEAVPLANFYEKDFLDYYLQLLTGLFVRYLCFFRVEKI